VEEVRGWGSEDHADLPVKAGDRPGEVDRMKSLGVYCRVRYGYLRGGENPGTGEGWDDETVAVEIRSPELVLDDGHRSDLSSVSSEIRKKYYGGYEYLEGP
jgi:hypothetical protein